MYQDLDRRLKSTAEKEQKKMTSDQDEKDLKDTHESTHNITLVQY